MKKKFFLIIFVLISSVATAQLRLSLDDVIALAKDSSLTAFRYKNMYLANYWNFKSFKAQRLPSLTLDVQPVVYNRQLVSRYDSENDIDI
ncbi:MAG: TolC family protein, partial [Bacteroidales bacterium]|nr:TolC family protein [Bacteroidales bacterium]